MCIRDRVANHVALLTYGIPWVFDMSKVWKQKINGEQRLKKNKNSLGSKIFGCEPCRAHREHVWAQWQRCLGSKVYVVNLNWPRQKNKRPKMSEKLQPFIKPIKINPFSHLRTPKYVVFHADSEKHTPDAWNLQKVWVLRLPSWDRICFFKKTCIKHNFWGRKIGPRRGNLRKLHFGVIPPTPGSRNPPKTTEIVEQRRQKCWIFHHSRSDPAQYRAIPSGIQGRYRADPQTK